MILNEKTKKTICSSLALLGIATGVTTLPASAGHMVIVTADSSSAIAEIEVDTVAEGPVSAYAELSYARGSLTMRTPGPLKAFASVFDTISDKGPLRSSYASVSWNGGSDSDSHTVG